MTKNVPVIRTGRMVAIRKKYKLKQTTVARQLNVTRQCYSQYETGRRIPDLPCLIKLSAFYKINIDYFINFEILNLFPSPQNQEFIPNQTIPQSNYKLFFLSPQEAALIERIRESDSFPTKSVIK